MSVPDEVRREAERTAELLRKKLLQVMDSQADIHRLLRDGRPTPFGSKGWEDASLEALQRLVAMTAIQFLLFEPTEWVKGNDELKAAGERMLDVIAAQLKALEARRSGRGPGRTRGSST
jgi:hypothetical protein